MKTGIIKGVTTNPSILKKVGKHRDEQIFDIVGLGIDNLYVQVVGDTVEERFTDYMVIKNAGKNAGINIGIKIPLDMKGMEVISRIKGSDKETSILGTAIYSAEQGILGAIAGCDYLAPYVNRMQNNSIDPYNEISKIRAVIDDRNLNTQILAAGFKNAGQVVEAMLAGAHTCTIPYDVLVNMLNRDVVTKAIQVFNEDGKATM